MALFTNGWWLEQTEFTATGQTYADESHYLADLQQHGVKHRDPKALRRLNEQVVKITGHGDVVAQG